ncbi:MAG TPA: hypothetical protein VJN89_08705 [Candidatus Acidoferrum sp.]|nr:hypothetical protein [Candidatus Acidoferrum sp.]
MKNLLILTLFLSPVAAPSSSQEVGYKDLVGMALREAQELYAGGTGSCSGGSHQPPPTTLLDITLLSVDKSAYVMGDDIESLVRISNAGKEPVLLPWDPHMADFEERADGGDYRYVEISMLLELSVGENKELIAGWSLSGSQDVAGSLLELQPGGWVQVRAKSKLEIYSDNEFQHRLYSGPGTDLKIKPSLLADTVTVSHKQGKAYLDSQCLKWGITIAGERTIRILPREVLSPPAVEH